MQKKTGTKKKNSEKTKHITYISYNAFCSKIPHKSINLPLLMKNLSITQLLFKFANKKTKKKTRLCSQACYILVDVVLKFWPGED